jgi:hypothetical protein
MLLKSVNCTILTKTNVCARGSKELPTKLEYYLFSTFHPHELSKINNMHTVICNYLIIYCRKFVNKIFNTFLYFRCDKKYHKISN